MATTMTNPNLRRPERVFPDDLLDRLMPFAIADHKSGSSTPIKPGERVRLHLLGSGGDRMATYLGWFEPLDDSGGSEVYRLETGELIENSLAMPFRPSAYLDPVPLLVRGQRVGTAHGVRNVIRFFQFADFHEMALGADCPDVPLSTLCQSTSPEDE